MTDKEKFREEVERLKSQLLRGAEYVNSRTNTKILWHI